MKAESKTSRRWRICVNAGAVFLLLHSPVAPASEVTELPGLSRQTMQLTITSSAGDTKTLEALVVRPDAPGPFPLALITHGLPRNQTEISAMRPELYISPAIVFAQHGYAAVVVMRSGYGRSIGPFAEDIGPCEQRTYIKAGNAAAADILSALSALQREPWVDPGRVLLIGHSMGGFAVLGASAGNPSGILGVITFAGAVGSPRPDYVCQPDRLIDAIGLSAAAPISPAFGSSPRTTTSSPSSRPGDVECLCREWRTGIAVRGTELWPQWAFVDLVSGRRCLVAAGCSISQNLRPADKYVGAAP